MRLEDAPALPAITSDGPHAQSPSKLDDSGGIQASVGALDGARSDVADDISNDLVGESSNEVIDVPAVARLLAVGRNTIYALVARNAIPHRRLGKQIRFHRAAVMRWLASWSPQGAKEGQ